MKLNWISMFTDTSHNLNMCFRCKTHYLLFIGLTICLFAFHTLLFFKVVGETFGLMLLQVIIFNLSRVYKLRIKCLTSLGSFPFSLSTFVACLIARFHVCWIPPCLFPTLLLSLTLWYNTLCFQPTHLLWLLSQTCHTEKNCVYVDI